MRPLNDKAKANATDYPLTPSRCVWIAILIAPWIWVLAFTYTYGWAIDELKTRHSHLRDMPIGAVIHYIGFVVMSLPISYLLGGVAFRPIVVSRYFRLGSSVFVLAGIAVGIGFVVGNLAATSMNAPAGIDRDTIVHSFVYANLSFALAFYILSQVWFFWIWRKLLQGVEILVSRLKWA